MLAERFILNQYCDMTTLDDPNVMPIRVKAFFATLKNSVFKIPISERIKKPKDRPLIRKRACQSTTIELRSVDKIIASREWNVGVLCPHGKSGTGLAIMVLAFVEDVQTILLS